jgi:SAM-dependent methyltransferase
MRKAYGTRAKGSTEGACNGKSPVAQQAGYTEEQLRSLPANALTTSAGCGNPTALAALRQGEVVLDLGSGGGIDVFLAAKKVGPTGKAIGVDMTPEMIDLARENARKTGAENVEFRLGEIEHLPLADESVDVIISNCVINLSPEKEKVFKEAHRVLKKGGRMLVSDMMVSGLPEEIRLDVSVWASCIGGAVELEEYVRLIEEAGFTQVEVIHKEEYSEQMIKNSIAAIERDLDDSEKKKLEDLVRKLEGDFSISHADIRAVKN